jgi:murein DD-endopeptidase MepM/ murein hydrolase activator NlpD
MVRLLGALLLLLAIAAGAVFYISSKETPPTVTVEQPERVVGQTGTLTVTAQTPAAKFKNLTITLEQNGQSTALYSLDANAPPTVGPNTVRISRPFGKQSVPQLRAGNARLVVTATRKSFLNLRTLTTTATRDIQVRLEPPRISVVSTHHYVNHGGSEFVAYRATPDDVLSGVRVGDIEYPGFPLGASDAAVKGAFFALLYDQPLNAKIVAFARDEAGNEATATFIDNVFEKPQKKSRIEIDDKLIDRVAPEIRQNSPDLKLDEKDAGDNLAVFLKENGELRQMNAEKILQLAKQTSPMRLWDGPFVQLGNSKVEAAFADHRTYVYKGEEVDHQVHLGFDLAVTSHVAVVAANSGTVLNASWLGIYGNCVILDHGMGVQSLYGHLSSFDVKVGDKVTRGQLLGRSGMTGMAGGDHLHFTMLVSGRMVNPVEWWDPHWISDRVMRKLAEAGVAGIAPVAESPQPQPVARRRRGKSR